MGPGPQQTGMKTRNNTLLSGASCGPGTLSLDSHAAVVPQEMAHGPVDAAFQSGLAGRPGPGAGAASAAPGASAGRAGAGRVECAVMAAGGRCTAGQPGAPPTPVGAGAGASPGHRGPGGGIYPDAPEYGG